MTGRGEGVQVGAWKPGGWGRGGAQPREPGPATGGTRSAAQPPMDPGEAEEGVPPPAGAPPRKRFVIPLEENEAPSAGAKPLFRSTRDLPAVETPAQPAPQTYAEYAISRSPAGAGALCPPGAEPLAGETPNQALKPGTKSNSIVVSPRQVRGRRRGGAPRVLGGRGSRGRWVPATLFSAVPAIRSRVQPREWVKGTLVFLPGLRLFPKRTKGANTGMSSNPSSAVL
uniref:Uncharacterized protein n=1 Tax=Oryctolagus cuniculus TaxID=9986 RepID=G1U5G5_RABIT